MNEARQAFAKVDATALDDDHDSYDIHIGEKSEDVTSVTVEFEQFEAESVEALEAKLDERAETVIEESGVDEIGPHFGYEIVREAGDTERIVGFVVTQPHI